MDQNDLKYLIALNEISHVGPIVGKELISHFGSAKDTFNAPNSELKDLGKVGRYIIEEKSSQKLLEKAETELAFLAYNSIHAFAYNDRAYPTRLKTCVDAPLVLYLKGNGKLDERRSISIVGTRKSTEYGQKFVNDLLEKLTGLDVAIHSGLAYGIDIAAHKKALEVGLPTYCTLAHGFDRIYPAVHRNVASKMLERGGWISEFPSGTNPDAQNFPKRNRIVAGISEATIVVESARKGGSLITADLANTYSRDVFALPGRVSDKRSAGCNFLIKTNRAHLLETPDDFLYYMGWDGESSKPVQTKLFPNLNSTEKQIVEVLKLHSKINIDEMALAVGMPMSSLSGTLLTMEFDGVVKQLPGKSYVLA